MRMRTRFPVHLTRIALLVINSAGSGCISAFLAQIIGPTEAAFVCTDINELALHATRQTGLRNGNTHLDVIQSSLLHALWPRCRAQVDVLLFNPPYVPTTEEEETVAQRLASIQGSWAGGALGTTLVEQILPLVPVRVLRVPSDKERPDAYAGICLVQLILAPKGRFYFVAIKQNDPDELVQRLIGLGLKADVCLSRRAGLEHLFILRAIRSE